MKDKVLYGEVMKAAESLARALRAYTGEPMNCILTVFTRDQLIKTPGDPEGIPDYYSVLIRSTECEHYDDSTMKLVNKIYYSDDEFGNEKIGKVIPYYEREADHE